MELTEYQRQLLAEVEAEKRKDKPDKDLIRRLAKRLSATDDRCAELKRDMNVRFGTRGRSPSWGKWKRDDE